MATINELIKAIKEGQTIDDIQGLITQLNETEGINAKSSFPTVILIMRPYGAFPMYYQYGASEERGTLGYTALHWAAARGREDVVGLLLQNGANIDAEDEDRATALHVAAKGGNLEVARLLLASGANIKHKKGFFDEEALHVAARNGHKDVVELLLEHDAKIDEKDGLGNTALHLAAIGYQDVVKALIDQGVDINATNEDGNTALHVAARNGHKDVVELLIKHKADINATNKAGTTALIWAALVGCTAIVELLIKHKADINAKDKNGATALIWAAYYGHTAVVKLLVQNGADITTNGKITETTVTAIDLILKKEGGASFFANLFNDLYLNYSAKELLSILQDIWSSVNFTEDKKSEFQSALAALPNTSLALHLLQQICEEGKPIAEQTASGEVHEHEPGQALAPALVGDSSAATSEDALNP